MCAQRRLKYACASVQSEQSLRCPHQNTWRTWLTATFGIYPSDTYAQRRLRSACASVQSDQSLRCPHEDTWHSRLYLGKDSDQTSPIRRLICAFAGRTCPKGSFSDVAARITSRKHTYMILTPFNPTFI